MKRYLLDTNIVIALVNNRSPLLMQRIRSHEPKEICISSIVSHELFYGAFKSQRIKANIDLVDSLQFEVIEFGKEDARQAGEIRAHLALEGKPIGPYDILIAGQAKSQGMVLVTHNIKEFNRIPGLLIEDWDF